MIELRVPGDKSISHRAILIGSLASDASLIRGLSDGVDVRRSIAVMRALGARIDTEPEPNGGLTARIGAGAGLEGPGAPLDCGNSGTTARLVAGILAGLGLEATLDGDASLRARPMRRVTYPLQAMGAAISAEDEPDRLPLRFGRRVSGSLRTLRHRPRIASAQVKSALLLAGLTGRTRVEITEPALSRDHTERMLRAMRAPIEFDPERRGGGSIRIDPEGWDGRLRGLDLTVPGDPSSAAFLIGAALLARRELRIAGVLANTGRIAFLEVLSEMGVAIERARASQPEAGEPVETWTLRPPARLRSFAIAGDRVPRLIDEIPLLCVLATRAEGRSEVRGAGELRAKESDRIRAIVENVRRLGGVAEERDDGLTIHGSDDSPAGVVRTFGDHRIAMAFGALEAAGSERFEIDDRACADISYPGFWEALAPFRSTGSGRPDPVGGPDEMPEGGEAATDPVRGRVVAIDGPAASGKSTTARSVADELGFVHVNSGLFYRAVTWWALREGLLPDDPRIARDVSELDIGLVDVEGGLTVSVDRRPLGDELRGADVTAHVSAVSTVPEVRAVVLERLRESGRRHSLVCDGRDIGTTVFPEAELKIFLVADVPERARRRLIERSEPATPETVEIEARRLEARDRTDASRASSPLRKAADAVEIDTTRIPPTEVVARIVALARDRGLESPESTGGSGPAPGARPC